MLLNQRPARFCSDRFQKYETSVSRQWPNWPRLTAFSLHSASILHHVHDCWRKSTRSVNLPVTTESDRVANFCGSKLLSYAYLDSSIQSFPLNRVCSSKWETHNSRKRSRSRRIAFHLEQQVVIRSFIDSPAAFQGKSHQTWRMFLLVWSETLTVLWMFNNLPSKASYHMYWTKAVYSFATPVFSNSTLHYFDITWTHILISVLDVYDSFPLIVLCLETVVTADKLWKNHKTWSDVLHIPKRCLLLLLWTVEKRL